MEASEPAELQVIKSHYEKAFECLDAGLLEDKAGNKGRAVVLYRLGRRHLLQGLEVATRGEHCAGADWDCARQMQLKMNETLSSITTRLAVLETACQGASGAQPLYPSLPVLQQPQRPARRPILNSRLSPTASGGVPFLPSSPVTASDVPSELPPAYTPQPTDGHFSLSHSEGKDWPSLPRPKQISRHQSLNEGGEDLLFLPYGVQIFFVTADGQVSAPSYPGYLRIILNDRQRHRDSNDISDIRQPPAYLQVCDWHYPLFPDSPVLLSNTGVFTFPDTTAAVPGSYVGVVLSSELSATDRALFQEHLSVLTQLRVQAADDEAGEPTGTDVVNLNEKAPISPSSDTATAMDTSPGKEENILPEWSEKMSQSILAVDGLSSVVELVGKELAPHVKKHGSKLIPESLKKNKDACTNMGGAKVVAASSLKGLSTLWSGLETAAKTIGKSASSETVLTVKHKE